VTHYSLSTSHAAPQVFQLAVEAVFWTTELPKRFGIYIREDVRTLPVRDAITLRSTSFVSPNIIHRAGRWRNICFRMGYLGTSVSSYMYIDEYVKLQVSHGGLSRIIFTWVIRQDYLAYFISGTKSDAVRISSFFFRTDHSGHEIASRCMCFPSERTVIHPRNVLKCW